MEPLLSSAQFDNARRGKAIATSVCPRDGGSVLSSRGRILSDGGFVPRYRQWLASDLKTSPKTRPPPRTEAARPPYAKKNQIWRSLSKLASMTQTESPPAL